MRDISDFENPHYPVEATASVRVVELDSQHSSTPEPPAMLSGQERMRLVSNAVRASGTISLDDLERIVEWAEETRLRQHLLRLALDGDVGVVLRNGEIAFGVIDGADSPTESA
jgi:hypothetical protein